MQNVNNVLAQLKGQILIGYGALTFEEAVVEHESEATKVAKLPNGNAKTSAQLKVECLEFVAQVFEACADKGHNVTQATFNEAYKLMTGSTLESAGGQGVVNGFVKTTDKIADVAVESVRKSANWIGNKLVQWTTK